MLDVPPDLPEPPHEPNAPEPRTHEDELARKLTEEYGFDAHPPEPTPESQAPVPLGHNRGFYYYYSRAAKQVVEIKGDNHSRGALASMASESHYWFRSPFATERGVDWNAAADDLRVRCRNEGIFNGERVRGRGVWLDGGRTVVNLGDRLWVDGHERGLILPESRYVYEAGHHIDLPLSEPLRAAEASQLIDVCRALPWTDSDSMSRLLAGWLVIAPLCGAMPWRPHIWITSEAGGGKGWVIENLIKPTMLGLGEYVQSKTTEPAIRALLQADARPVIFDEAETQNKSDSLRMQQVLDLARQASSENGASIVKSTQTGKPIIYRVRSCFAFASINVELNQTADESRTVVLELQKSIDKKKAEDQFDKLKKIHYEHIFPDFGARLLARSVRLIPQIRENAEVFAQAISRETGSRRTGDTIGVILAGAWSLHSRRVATSDEAREFVSGKDWVKKATSRSEVDPDWSKALQHLLQAREHIPRSSGPTEYVPISELIGVVARAALDSNIKADYARLALLRANIRVDWPIHKERIESELRLVIGNSSSAAKRAFEGSPWESSWVRTLARAPGAEGNKQTRFGDISNTKATWLPLKHAIGEAGE